MKGFSFDNPTEFLLSGWNTLLLAYDGRNIIKGVEYTHFHTLNYIFVFLSIFSKNILVLSVSINHQTLVLFFTAHSTHCVQDK